MVRGIQEVLIVIVNQCCKRAKSLEDLCQKATDNYLDHFKSR